MRFFWVLLPMVIGPFIGERIITFFGQPIVGIGKSGFLPTYLIFIASAVVTLVAILPVHNMIRGQSALRLKYTGRVARYTHATQKAVRKDIFFHGQTF
jgi:hypothetical protein